METLPKEPYEAHERQVMGQVAMLDGLWDAPRFTLRREDGSITHANMGFPELCRRELGLNLPDDPEKVSIEGWLLCVSMRNARAFGPYLWDTDALERLREQANEYWALLCGIKDGRVALADISHAKGFYPLCTSCQFNGDCPKFPQGENQPQWEPALDKLERLKERRAALDGEIKELESALNVAHQLSGTQDWISTGSYRFRVSQIAGRSALNREALKEELSAIFWSEHMDDLDVDALLARHERVGAPSSRLTVNAIN